MINTISPIESEILKKRGFTDTEEMLGFLNMTPEMLPEFSSLADGGRVLEGISRAVDTGLHITIYGDYDADGVMAMTILYKGLVKLAPDRVNWFVNNRFDDGYSITADSIFVFDDSLRDAIIRPFSDIPPRPGSVCGTVRSPAFRSRDFRVPCGRVRAPDAQQL